LPSAPQLAQLTTGKYKIQTILILLMREMYTFSRK